MNNSTPDSERFFASANRRQVFLRRGRERSVNNRHPWIFSGAIEREEGPADAAIADVISTAGDHLTSGFYSTHSQVRVRALTLGDETLTPDLIRTRIRAAIDRRRLVLSRETDAVRLVNSEGDDLSGLVVDSYNRTLAVEITSAGLEKMADLVTGALQEAVNPESIVFKNDLPARRIEKLGLEDRWIGASGDVEIRENGLLFAVSPASGQKTGFFLDQRDNRQLARALANGCDVLNLFCYSGAFGVYAAAGGARSVEEIDVSATAIEAARRNHQLNGSVDASSFHVANAFEHTRSLVTLGRSFDLVVCDPPAFAKSRADTDRAARGYKDINLQAIRLVRPGGWLMTFSCSGHISADLFQKIVFAAALDAGRQVTIERRLGAGADHPVSIYCPEGEYLKGLLLRVGE